MTTKMRNHPAADLFPMMTNGELDSLAKDIAGHGQRDPILLVDDAGEWLVLDGRNRLEACRRAGVQPKTAVWAGDDPIAAVWSFNCERRHLSDSQRAMIGEGFAKMKHGGNRKGDNIKAPAGALTDSASQVAAAQIVGVSRRLIQRARRVRAKGAPELVAAVQAGDVSVTAAAEIASLPVEEQRLLVANGASAVVERANRREEARSPAPRLVVHNGGALQETKPGVFQHLNETQRAMVAEQILYDLSVEPPKWRTHHDRHEQIRKLLAKGMRVREIIEATGFDRQFVQHSMAPYRIRPKVMGNVISDTQVMAETWTSWARRIEQKWPGASREEKDQLIEQLEACRRSAGTFIRELKKDARNEGEIE